MPANPGFCICVLCEQERKFGLAYPMFELSARLHALAKGLYHARSDLAWWRSPLRHMRFSMMIVMVLLIEKYVHGIFGRTYHQHLSEAGIQEIRTWNGEEDDEQHPTP